MLYFLHGENFEKARAKASELLEGMKKKKPGASVFEADSDNFNQNRFEEWIGGQGLFENKHIVFLKNVFENLEAREWILGKLSEISKSENVFLFLEKKINKEILSKIEKVGGKIQEFAGEKGKGRQFAMEGGRSFNTEEFNIFSIAEAFGRRDRKNMWVLFEKAQERKIPAEEICGIIFWQLKSMILASEAKTAGEADLKPFVFSKAKAFSRNYKPEELKNISSKLVSLYHDSHRGLHDFNHALEKFILGI